jgi:hypothetical protein
VISGIGLKATWQTGTLSVLLFCSSINYSFLHFQDVPVIVIFTSFFFCCLFSSGGTVSGYFNTFSLSLSLKLVIDLLF